ncbi:MAG: protocatechuate 3,4-dioxygenase subunit beta [Thermoleophilaceae bacterium]
MADSQTDSGILLPGYRHDNVEVDPPLDWPDYRSTSLRAPKNALVDFPHTLSEVTGPMLGEGRLGDLDNDLTRQHRGSPIGQRINVSGRVLDGNGRPIPGSLVEIWQANAAGRYRHNVDRTPAPLDPNFTGVGRCVTDSDGRYHFVTIMPGAYPWGNHHNAWRPRHIHFSLFGRAFAQRLVTQMYFPGDPVFPEDPIFNSVRDPKARERLISSFDWDTTEDSWALGFKWDIVLRGRDETPFEEPHEE